MYHRKIDAFTLLGEKKSTYPTVVYGKLNSGIPVLWSVLDKMNDKVLLLSESALSFCSEVSISKTLRQLEETLFCDQCSVSEPSELFLPDYQMVNHYLSGNNELLCRGSRHKTGFVPLIDPLWSLGSQFVPWFIADNTTSLSKNTISYDHRSFANHVDVPGKSILNYPGNPGDVIDGEQWCVSDQGSIGLSVRLIWRDNLAGGGFYQQEYGIRPACWVREEYVKAPGRMR